MECQAGEGMNDVTLHPDRDTWDLLEVVANSHRAVNENLHLLARGIHRMAEAMEAANGERHEDDKALQYSIDRMYDLLERSWLVHLPDNFIDHMRVMEAREEERRQKRAAARAAKKEAEHGP